MANWTRMQSPSFSDNDDTFDTETYNMCSDEPIDLKQVNNCDPNQNHEDASCDWDTAKLVKSKAFRIKDILGLEDNDKLVAVSTPNPASNFIASTPLPLTTTRMCASFYLSGKQNKKIEKKN